MILMRLLDRLIDRTTMYRLVFWYLAVLLAAAFGLGVLKLAAIDPIGLLLSSVLVLASGYLANQVFARVFGAVPNVESVYITGMIIVLIMPPAPATDIAAVGAVVAASVWAMASKYILSLRRRHVFNPAALGVALPALLLDQPATWWVSGQLWLMPVVVIGGLLIVRKLRRIDLVAAFAVANLAATVLTSTGNSLGSIKLALFDSPFLFFAFVMLTEPLTAPQGRFWRVIYGVLVGVLASPTFAVLGYYFTPEVALLAGNLLTLLVSPQGRLVLTLDRIEKAAAGAYDFVFQPDRQFAFAAGQYLEWTMPLDRSDSRGNRRYFTVASAPTEGEVRLGVKFAPQGSAFKRELAALRPGGKIIASQLAGNFTMPRNANRKLCFVAGGIGITPFRSMLKELIDHRARRDIVVLYGCGNADEFAYADVLREAQEKLGIVTHLAVLDPSGAGPEVEVGMIDEAIIQRLVSDYKERTFYVSGPAPMVNAMRGHLQQLGLPFWRIKTDFFPGLA